MRLVPKTEKPEWKGDSKSYTLALFDHMKSVDDAEKTEDLNARRRQVEENAKKRF